MIFVIDGQSYQIVPGEGEISSLPGELSDVEESPEKQPGSRKTALPTLCSFPLIVSLVMMGVGEGKRKGGN